MKKRPKIPRYLRKLLAQVRTRQLVPGVHEVRVLHDDGCDLLAGRGPCSCDPDVQLDLPGRS